MGGICEIGECEITTPDELAALEATGALCAAYWKLPIQHPDEPQDFADAIHKIQDLIAIRVARRADPENWPCKDSRGNTIPINDP